MSNGNPLRVGIGTPVTLQIGCKEGRKGLGLGTTDCVGLQGG